MADMYLYNGVELPALPEWDKTVYPYAYIHTNGDGTIFLCVCPNPVQWTVDGMLRHGETKTEKTTWVFSNGTWQESTCMYYVYRPHDEADTDCTLYWTNTDVPTQDGNGIFLAASDPIPVGGATPTLDPTSLLMGWLTGEMVKAMLSKKKEPVTYLYNGVRLPKLPEVEGYDNAFTQNKDDVFLVLSNAKLYEHISVSMPEKYPHALTWETAGTSRFYQLSGAEWVFAGSVDHQADESYLGAGELVFWSSCSIYNEDGITLFLEGSAPIPVYE